MNNLLSPQKICVISQWDEENRSWWASKPAKEMKGSPFAQIDYCPIPQNESLKPPPSVKIWGLGFWNSNQMFSCHLWTTLWKPAVHGFRVFWFFFGGWGPLWYRIQSDLFSTNARNDVKTNAWCDMACEPAHTCSWSSPCFWQQHTLSRKAEMWLISELNCGILVLL